MALIRAATVPCRSNGSAPLGTAVVVVEAVTSAAAERAGYERVSVRATGPTGIPCWSTYLRRGDEAVVELADARVNGRTGAGGFSPLSATSRGTGDLLAAAMEAGCRRIVVTIGGSASTDGGAGLLEGLGAWIRGPRGRALRSGGGALADAVSLDFSELHPGLATVELIVACDADNPLTGPRGAAAVNGPRTGATPGEVRVLDAALSAWAYVVAAATRRDLRNYPGAGAGGGVGFALLAVLGARMQAITEVSAEL